MYKRARWLVAALALCTASAALAVGVGERLYVKARNTRLMASASPTANVKAILQPGQEVKWLGADPKNKQWHNVEVDGKKGLVFQSNLSTKPPGKELLVGDGAPKGDTRALASSGAAVRGLSDGAIAYGNEKGQKTPSFTTAVEQVQALENHVNTIQPSALAAHAEKAHLFPVVGPRETASRGGR